jgi:hypothetical protein
MSKETDKEKALDIQEQEMLTDDTSLQAKADNTKSALEQLKQSVTEDDTAPASSLSFLKIIGGDVLSSQVVRQQVWLCLLIALFLTFYVAFRYQCQQDMIDIAQLETELKDAKYKALSSSSNLTERCRESLVLKALLENLDSAELPQAIHPSSQPPYKVYVPEVK